MIYDLYPIERIAMLSVHTSPLARLGQQKTGGMNVYVRDFTRELARRGIQVDIFTRKVDPGEPSISYDLGCGCRVVAVPAGPLTPVPNDNIVNYLDEFAAGVINFARTYGVRYDLIHSHYWLSGLVAGRLQQAWGPTPIVHMYHTLGHMKNQIAQSETELSAQVRLLGEAQVAHIADRLIAATPSEESQLLKWYGADPTKISVLSPGVDVARFEPLPQCRAKQQLGIPGNRRLVLFVGRIEPLKGVDTLLSAAALLKEQHPAALKNVQVAIVGGDPSAPDAEMSRLLELHRELDLGGLVEFLGAREQAQLPNYYAAADAVVMPSHYESFGMVALEAMAMGTPVIASRVGGLAHLVRDNATGFLISPRSPQQLADRLQLLLTNEPLRQQLAAQARSYARGFDWANIVNRMLEVYATVSEPVPAI
jgi:D-inositol-3-phosphate glycosyltransferase